MAMRVGSLESGAVHADRYLTAAAGGVRLRYRDEGRGPAVLFVHGWTLDLDMWDPQIAFLRERFRCIRFDRRGFGLSDGIPSLQNDVGDALALCRSLSVEQFACVGMSQGARIALHLATHEPAILSCVVLDGPPHLWANPVSEISDVPTLRDARDPFAQESLQDFRAQWRRHPLMQLRAANQDNRSLLDRMIDRYPGRDLTAQATSASLAVDAHALHAIRTPILVIGGEHDLQSRLSSAAELTLALPTATRAVVSGAGHLANLDNPRAYNAHLLDFLSRCH
jgi:pimeloyl-ACP methyl ester carboxylesterase